MFYSYFISRIACVASCGVAVLYTGAAHAQTCASSYKDAQDKEKVGHLVEARELYSSCAKQTCGQFLLNECTTRHARLDSDIPSVVLVATHKSGKPYLHVQVTLDGEPFASGLDGRSLQVDPGPHEFVFTTKNGVLATEKVLILQGDRNRRILASLPRKPRAEADADVALPTETETTHDEATDLAPHALTRQPSSAPTEPPKEEPHSKGVPALSWVLGGVAVLGGGSYAVFSSWGKKDNQVLQEQCAPACQQSSVDRVKQRFLVADISLGVGVAALGGAFLAYALRGSSEEPSPEMRQAGKRPERAALAVDVHPTQAGAVASFSGSF
jgi:hypothetical protein